MRGIETQRVEGNWVHGDGILWDGKGQMEGWKACRRMKGVSTCVCTCEMVRYTSLWHEGVWK